MSKNDIRVVAGAGTALYELRGATKRYGDGATQVAAVDGIDLTIAPGEFVAIVGPSGSGKTTMLQLLGAIDRPSEGEVLFEGAGIEAMADRDLADLRRDTLGFIFQQFNLIPTLTARENVEAAMAPTGISNADRHRRAEELLERVGLGKRGGHVPSQLSGGEQQRVAIARALSNQPRVLLADEPTGELDEATSAEVLEAMRGVNRETGVTTLIVTHDPTVSEHVARTVQIRDGRTSTETLRRTETDEHGRARHVSEEFAVLDRVGRLQLPEEFTKALDLKDRVRLALEPDHVGVWPDAPSGTARPGGHEDPDGARDAVGSGDVSRTVERDTAERGRPWDMGRTGDSEGSGR
jgi:ABC-type lipoprotein export system ATPase subunit